MSLIEVSSNFFETLSEKYDFASKNDLVLFNGELAINELVNVQSNGKEYEYQLTLLDTLKHKPEKGNKDDNPFLKPEPELTILDNFGPNKEFKIIFNKFPVVPKHFMLVTKEFKSQDTPLSPDELIATYSILSTLKKQDKSGLNWFAFYNCGPNSGASQPHKHIQFMTLPNGYTPSGEILANTSSPFIPNDKEEPLQDPDLPYAHFLARLPDNENDLEGDDLTMYFVSLLQRALTVLKENEQDHISYNFCLTTKYMMLVPRSNGLYKNSLGINSCGAMGLFLCKSQELLDLIKHDGPENLLSEVGFPNTAGQPTDEYHY